MLDFSQVKHVNDVTSQTLNSLKSPKHRQTQVLKSLYSLSAFEPWILKARAISANHLVFVVPHESKNQDFRTKFQAAIWEIILSIEVTIAKLLFSSVCNHWMGWFKKYFVFVLYKPSIEAHREFSCLIECNYDSELNFLQRKVNL